MTSETSNRVSTAALAAFKASITTGTFKAIASAAQERNVVAARERAKPSPVEAKVWRPAAPIAVYNGRCVSAYERAAAIAEINRLGDESGSDDA